MVSTQELAFPHLLSSSSTTTVTQYPTGWTQSWKSWKKWFSRKQATSVYTYSAQTFLTSQKTHKDIPQNNLLPAIFQILIINQYFNLKNKYFIFKQQCPPNKNIGISFRQALKDQILFHLPIFIRSACSLIYFTFSV